MPTGSRMWESRLSGSRRGRGQLHLMDAGRLLPTQALSIADFSPRPVLLLAFFT